jgi:hypothetical protein
VPAATNPSGLHRVFEDGKPKFQLRKGEEGLSSALKKLEAAVKE